MRTEKEVREKKLEIIETFLNVDNLNYNLKVMRKQIMVLDWFLGKEWKRERFTAKRGTR